MSSSTRSRLSEYAAVATAASVAPLASAGVTIVTLAQPQHIYQFTPGFYDPTHKLDLGPDIHAGGDFIGNARFRFAVNTLGNGGLGTVNTSTNPLCGMKQFFSSEDAIRHSGANGYLVGYSNLINGLEDWGSGPAGNVGGADDAVAFNPAGKTYWAIRVATSLVDGNPADYRYGWIEFEGAGGGIYITRYAWESEIGVGITTPAGSSAPAVPGLGGLAALACGAAGVRRSRTRVA